MTRRWLSLVLLVSLAGCVAAPARRQPDAAVTVPERWTAGRSAAGEPKTEWWESFGDPHLPELIRIALEQNHDLKAASARLDRAAAEARIAGADLRPSVGIGASGARRRQNFIGFPIPGSTSEILSTTSTSYGLSLDTAWEADLWGRIRAGARAAVAELEATEADVRGARLSLAGATAKLWFLVIEARQQAALARDSAESFRVSAEQVRSRFESGIRPALDLRLALSNLAAAEALLQVRSIQLDRATRLLEVVLGRYPDGSVIEALDADELPPAPAAVPAGLPAELVARRPDLVAVERRLAAADQRSLAARRALYPRLSLTGGGGTVSDDLGDLLDGDFRVWSLLGSLTQPLFQGGRLRANVDRADAAGREVLELYVSRVLGAFAEVESALAAEELLAERERHVADTAAQLKAARRLAEDRYRRGVGIYLTVLESQSRALTAESELLSVRRQRLDNRVDLHLALGGGFEPDAAAGTSPPSDEGPTREGEPS